MCGFPSNAVRIIRHIHTHFASSNHSSWLCWSSLSNSLEIHAQANMGEALLSEYLRSAQSTHEIFGMLFLPVIFLFYIVFSSSSSSSFSLFAKYLFVSSNFFICTLCVRTDSQRSTAPSGVDRRHRAN